jgi:SAM-dependent methyltransferase
MTLICGGIRLVIVAVPDCFDTLSARRLAWDYTALADAYVARPDYADAAIREIAALTGLPRGASALDLGAGAGHLTIKIAGLGWDVLALEPNAAMRAHGIRRTRELHNVRWVDGVMESTGQAAGSFSACTYGSSFGVVDRAVTLREAARLLEDEGWFACVFNHRALDDPLQQEIEAFIKSRLPDYDYGTRREEQSEVIEASGFFRRSHRIEAPVSHVRPVEEWITAWRSHATLQRQSGDRFPEIVDGIAAIIARTCTDRIEVPYVTRGWVAQRLPRAACA